jgi:hypothetical protein
MKRGDDRPGTGAPGHLFKSAQVATTAVEEILAHAKAKCMRDYLALVEAETQFLQ